jgi:hypothetical protein
MARGLKENSMGINMLSLPFGRLLGWEYRNNVLLCAAITKGRLAVLNCGW